MNETLLDVAMKLISIHAYMFSCVQDHMEANAVHYRWEMSCNNVDKQNTLDHTGS